MLLRIGNDVMAKPQILLCHRMRRLIGRHADLPPSRQTAGKDSLEPTSVESAPLMPTEEA